MSQETGKLQASASGRFDRQGKAGTQAGLRNGVGLTPNKELHVSLLIAEPDFLNSRRIVEQLLLKHLSRVLDGDSTSTQISNAMGRLMARRCGW